MTGRAYLPSYDHDIFVSYAHQGQLGPWTLQLQQELTEALNLILFLKPPGKVVDVWVDKELQYNLELTPQLKARVEGSALLLVVMSPFYLASPWCGKEVTWFAEMTRIAPRARVFVVHAQPTERKAWPPSLTDLEPYPFFARHAKASIELPLGLIGDEPDKANYKAQVYLLAGQIKQQIDDLLKEGEERRQEEERQKRAEEERQKQAMASPPPLVVPAFPPSPRTPVLLPRMVFLETAGNPASVSERAFVDEVYRALEALNVEVATLPTPAAVPPDPIGAERLFQNLLNAKASADGLILLRLDAAAMADAWQLEYLSEIRLRSLKIRGGPPGRLLINAASAGVQTLGSRVPLLGWGEPDAADTLRAWVENLPLAAECAA